MRKRYNLLLLIIALLICLRCEPPSEPTEYTHTQAGFKVVCPAGWSKIDEDKEMYEFRSGSVKLIEVGGFDLEMPEDTLNAIFAEGVNVLEELTLDGLEGYNEEAKLVSIRIDDQYQTTWGGESAYRVRETGYSEEAEVSMVVDLVACLFTKNGRVYMYMFASQIAESEYQKIKSELETTIASFQILK